MSRFLDGLIEKFKIGRGDKVYKYTDLFPNTYKMMQIGEVMDELVELGFRATSDKLIPWYVMMVKGILIDCSFQKDMVVLYEPISGGDGFYYTSPTWQEDLINRVKELINE